MKNLSEYARSLSLEVCKYFGRCERYFMAENMRNKSVNVYIIV